MTNENDECCPEFNPEKFDEKWMDWKDKKFIKESMPTFFHIPFTFLIGKKISKLWKAASDSGAILEDKNEALILFHDPSPFKSEIYLSVSKNVPNENNVTLSGTFASKVFDGGYNAVPKFLEEMNKYLAKTGDGSSDMYIHYTYCPKCAKKYGHNYMIFFAKI